MLCSAAGVLAASCAPLSFSAAHNLQRCRAATVAVNSSKSKEWVPLLDHAVALTKEFFTETQPITTAEALVLLQQDSLLARPSLFAHLNQAMESIKVRTVVNTHGGQPVTKNHTSGVAYIDPRCPHNIHHPDPADPSQVVSCAQAINRHGHELQHPQLLCVALKRRWGAVEAHQPDTFVTYPLECCRCLPEKQRCKAGNDSLSMIAVAPEKPCKLPPEIAALFAQHDAGMPAEAFGALPSNGVTAAAAPPAPAAPRLLGDRPFPAAELPRTVDDKQPQSASVGQQSGLDSNRAPGADSASAGHTVLPPNINKQTQRIMGMKFMEEASKMYPTEEENRHVSATVAAVQRVVQQGCTSKAWSVASLLPVGSSQKKTSLRGMQDLDLLIELQSSRDCFEAFENDRMECLDAVCNLLCTPAAPPLDSMTSTLDAAQLAGSGWELRLALPHYMQLSHPVLQLQLDIQACPSLASQFSDAPNSQWRQELLRHLIQRAKAEQGLGPAPKPVGKLAEHLTRPTSADKQRASLLTPWLTSLVKGAAIKCKQEYGLDGTGSLVTTVTRVVKARVKEFLAEHGKQGMQSTSNIAAAEHPAAQRPPGYCFEILVLYVLQQELERCKAAGVPAADVYGVGATRELMLFLSVLKAASQLLRPAACGDSCHEVAPAIALTTFYTTEECEHFRRTWGPPGRLNTPYIIHPADPSYNCTANAGFVAWEVIADAAGKLHAQLIADMQAPATAGEQGL